MQTSSIRCSSRPTMGLVRRAKAPSALRVMASSSQQAPKQPQEQASASTAVQSVLLSSAATFAPLLMCVESAIAKDGEYGLLEGRTFALIHPAVMFGLLAATGYAGYLGLQWKRTRLIGDEIRDLRKRMPAPAADGTIAASPIADEIATKEKERKELLAGNFKDKHHVMGSLLLASGTGIAIAGAANTFMRTGKLFPGPHLYAGAGIVGLWAMAAALVPEMQKGNETARTAHIALNCVNLALFLWQVPTGLDIVGKVFQFTQWP